MSLANVMNIKLQNVEEPECVEMLHVLEVYFIQSNMVSLFNLLFQVTD